MRNIQFQLAHLTFWAVLFGSCASSPAGAGEVHSDYHESIAEESVDDKLEKYEGLKERIINKQKKFTVEYPTVDQAHQQGLVSLAKNYINTTLSDSIWSHWYGTTWDFYGTTQTPGKGEIACGYFVTTTLKHVGYNIDRVKLAQQAASVIITTMCGPGKTKIIGNNNKEALMQYMLDQEDGVFICGLDNHVGFIQKVGGEVYFVHSSGFSNELKVIKEKLLESNAINFSNAYYVGDLLGNESNLIKWIRNEKINMQ
jgi:hypothetical protein